MKDMKIIRLIMVAALTLVVGSTSSIAAQAYDQDRFEMDECGAYTLTNHRIEGCDSTIVYYTWVQGISEGNRNTTTQEQCISLCNIDPSVEWGSVDLNFYFKPQNYSDIGIWPDHTMWALSMNIENGDYAATEYVYANRDHLGEFVVLNKDFQRGEIDWSGDTIDYGEITNFQNEERVFYAMYGTSEWIDDNVEEFSNWAREYETARLTNMPEALRTDDTTIQIPDSSQEDAEETPVVENMEPVVTVIETATTQKLEESKTVPTVVCFAILATLAVVFVVVKKIRR